MASCVGKVEVKVTSLVAEVTSCLKALPVPTLLQNRPASSPLSGETLALRSCPAQHVAAPQLVKPQAAENATSLKTLHVTGSKTLFSWKTLLVTRSTVVCLTSAWCSSGFGHCTLRGGWSFRVLTRTQCTPALCRVGSQEGNTTNVVPLRWKAETAPSSFALDSLDTLAVISSLLFVTNCRKDEHTLYSLCHSGPQGWPTPHNHCMSAQLLPDCSHLCWGLFWHVMLSDAICCELTSWP